MTETTKCKHICPFCGDEITYTHFSEDGYDWEGHHRGSAKDWNNFHPCPCEERKYKQMCVNCKFYDADTVTCRNSEVVHEWNAMLDNQNVSFQIPDVPIKIKKPTNHCKYWHLNADLIEKYFK